MNFAAITVGGEQEFINLNEVSSVNKSKCNIVMTNGDIFSVGKEESEKVIKAISEEAPVEANAQVQE